ncbi:MAG: TatD family hydrolase [Patescibacteria group bacterium]
MFDTHCHLNFKAFDGQVEDVINEAKKVGVNQIMIPGTDFETSKKAVEIAEKYKGIYAAVGIHPHHVFEIYKTQVSIFSNATPQRGPWRLSQKQKPEFNSKTEKFSFASDLKNIEKLLSHSKVVAIGEVGIDRHIYQKTKYPDYKIGEEFVKLQKIILKEQILLSIKYDKSLVLHNREAKADMFEVLNKIWDKKLEGRSVFHCCEPDPELLKFAKKHRMFIGIDGDITYYKEKQDFIKTVPLEMLVLETDSPFLMPRLLSIPRPLDKYNEPKNIKIIAEYIASLFHCSIDKLSKQTTENARRLFKVSPSKKV